MPWRPRWTQQQAASLLPAVAEDVEKAEDVGEAVLRMQVLWCQQMEKAVSWDAQGADGTVAEDASRAGIPATCIEEPVGGHEPVPRTRCSA